MSQLTIKLIVGQGLGEIRNINLPAQLKAGDIVTGSFEIHNVGTAPARFAGCFIRLDNGDTVCSSMPGPEVQPGEFVIITLPRERNWVMPNYDLVIRMRAIRDGLYIDDTKEH